MPTERPRFPDTGSWFKPDNSGEYIMGKVFDFFTNENGRTIMLQDVVIGTNKGKDAYTFAKISHQSLNQCILESDKNKIILIRYDGMVKTRRGKDARSYTVFDVSNEDVREFRNGARQHDFPYRDIATAAPAAAATAPAPEPSSAKDVTDGVEDDEPEELPF